MRLTSQEAALVLQYVVEDDAQKLRDNVGIYSFKDDLLGIAQPLDGRPSHELLAEALREWLDRRRG